MKNIMKEAHKMTREIKINYPEVDYQAQLGLCISYLLENKREESKVDIKAMVKKFKLELAVKDGAEGIMAYGEISSADRQALKDNKPEIIQYLKELEANKKRRDEIRKEEDRKWEENRKRWEDEVIASGEAKLAVTYSGHYLADRELAYVWKLTPEEEHKVGFRDFYKGKLYRTIRVLSDNGVIAPDRKSEGYLTRTESELWILSDDEKTEVLKNIEKTKEEDRAKKKAEEESEKREQEQREAKFQEAKETGEPVLLGNNMVPCNDPKEECSWDMLTEYAMPDGTVRWSRQHTW